MNADVFFVVVISVVLIYFYDKNYRNVLNTSG